MFVPKVSIPMGLLESEDVTVVYTVSRTIETPFNTKHKLLFIQSEELVCNSLFLAHYVLYYGDEGMSRGKWCQKLVHKCVFLLHL